MMNPDNIYINKVIDNGKTDLKKLIEDFDSIVAKIKRKNKTRKNNKSNKSNKSKKHKEHKGGGKLNKTRKQILNKF